MLVTPELTRLAVGGSVESSRSYDYVAVIPYSSNAELGPNGEIKPRLSVLSEMAIEAALRVQNTLPHSRLIMPGETTFGPAHATTTELMVDYAKARMPDLENNRLVGLFTLPDGRPLNNTFRQMEALAYYFGNNKQSAASVSLVGLSYHMPRFRMVAETYGLGRFDLRFIEAEDVLREDGASEYDSYFPLVENFGGKSEQYLRNLTALDSRGYLADLIMRFTGPRINDICKDENGSLTPYPSYARKKLAELEREQTLRRRANAS